MVEYHDAVVFLPFIFKHSKENLLYPCIVVMMVSVWGSFKDSPRCNHLQEMFIIHLMLIENW